LRPKLEAGECGLDRDWWVEMRSGYDVEKSRAVYPPLGALCKASLAVVEEAIKRSLELV